MTAPIGASKLIPINLRDLAKDTNAHLILRLGRAYNDLANVSLLNRLAKSGELHKEIRLSATMYLLIQNIVHLVGAVESLPEVVADWEAHGPLYQKVQRASDKKRIEELLCQLSEYLEAKDRPTKTDGVLSKTFRQQLNNLRDNIGAHYNPTKKGKFLNRALQDIVVSADHAHESDRLKSGIIQIDGDTRFLWADDATNSGWQTQCIGIMPSSTDAQNRCLIKEAREYIDVLKDTFTEFAFRAISAYLKLDTQKSN